jgi:uncharacterized protein YndB with AHSA1/START domain
MGTDRIEVADVIRASAEEIYEAWLDAEKHTAMTGGRATSDGRAVGTRFTAWDDYIWGEHLALEPNRKIVQAWTTSEFPPGSTPSRVEVVLEPLPDGTRVMIVHTEIPEGQGARYEGGWRDFYFTPMKKHFGQQVEAMADAEPKAKAAPKKKIAAKAAPKKKIVAKAAPKKKIVAKAAPKKKIVAKAAPKKKTAKKKTAKRPVKKRSSR